MGKLSEEKQKVIETAFEEISTGVTSILTSDEWKAWLSLMAKFHDYSPLNTIWLWSQWEERRRIDTVARFMASFMGPAWASLPAFEKAAAFSTWKKLDHPVRKGEKGLHVLAPVFIKKTEEGVDRQVLIGYKVINRTFEISQTTGDPLPENPVKVHPLQGECDETIWGGLLQVAEEANFPVELETLPSHLFGYCRYTELDTEKPAAGRIVINSLNSPFQRTKTLIHEVSHAILHNPQEYELAHADGRSQAEVEAESTAFVVAEALGMETESYSFGYVAGWSKGNPKAVGQSATRILETAAHILLAMETGKLAHSTREQREIEEQVLVPA